MVIIGVDPGNARCGWGVIRKDGSRLACLAWGCIETDKGTPRGDRLAAVGRALGKIVRQWKPATAAVEDIFFFKNAKTAVVVSEARGVILATLAKEKVPQSSYTPLQVKQSVAAYGRAEKFQVAKMVVRILNLDAQPKPDDAVDALAAAICHAHTIR